MHWHMSYFGNHAPQPRTLHMQYSHGSYIDRHTCLSSASTMSKEYNTIVWSVRKLTYAQTNHQNSVADLGEKGVDICLGCRHI